MIIRTAFSETRLFQELPNILQESVRVAFGDLVSTVSDMLRAVTPIDTGELVGSWEAEIDKESVAWGTSVFYAPIVEFGGYPRVGPKTKLVGNKIYSAWVADNEPPGMVTHIASDKELHEDVLSLIVDEFVSHIESGEA